jgi:hypothetical protein
MNGGKGAPGVAQQIISLMPEHQIYVEPFLGEGRVFKKKRPARWNILNDIDVQRVVSFSQASHYCPWLEGTGFERVRDMGPLFSPHNDVFTGLCCRDAIDLLQEAFDSGFWGTRQNDDVPVMVYLDPPYLFSVRKNDKKLFEHEYGDVAEHIRLIELIETVATLPNIFFLLSGYESALYDGYLSLWETISFPAGSRSGKVVEKCWANYSIPPRKYHDYRFVGKDRRQRFQFTRRRQQLMKRIKRMTLEERRAFLQHLSWEGINAGQ